MTITLFAQPYDISAEGFYFRDTEEFNSKAKKLFNRYGDPVEEFEIQFIDGDLIDCELAKTIDLNQANFPRFLECVEEWDNCEKQVIIIAVGECGYTFTTNTTPEDFEVDIYSVDSMRELAEQFIDDGMFGDILEPIANYIDYDSIARDLACDYTESVIGGKRLVYRCS